MEPVDIELYIQLRDGQPHEHPIFGDNFRQAFPDVDVNNLPTSRFAKFIRITQPIPGTFEVYEGVTYEWDGDIVKDVHHVRPMTEEERAAKTEEILADLDRARLARIAFTNDILLTDTSESAQTAWLDCLTKLEAWKLETIDPLWPPFPGFPVKDEAGNWIAPPVS